MKKEKNNILKIENLLKILLILVLISSVLIFSFIFAKNYFEKKELNESIKELNVKLDKLNKDKENLTIFNLTDITNIQKKFENKIYNKNLLDIETGKVEFIEKVLKKDTNKFYATIKVPITAKTELDFKKFILFQSLNRNIYKLTEITRDKNIIKIELIYEI